MEITSIRWKSVGRWICIFYIQLRLQKLNVQTVYKFEGTEYRLSDLRPTFWSRDKLAIFFEFFIFFFFSFETCVPFDWWNVRFKNIWEGFLEYDKLFVIYFFLFFSIYYSREDKKILVAKIEFFNFKKSGELVSETFNVIFIVNYIPTKLCR